MPSTNPTKLSKINFPVLWDRLEGRFAKFEGVLSYRRHKVESTALDLDFLGPWLSEFHIRQECRSASAKERESSRFLVLCNG